MMKRIGTGTILGLLLVLGLSACTTTRGPSRIDVRVLPGGDMCRVRGKRVATDRLVRALKSEGLGANTRVTITVPAGAPNAVRDISRRLSSAGIRKYHFVSERRAIAETTKPRR